ncbi:MAG: helix-turn-helix domain-containing protein [Eubacterium sp.]|nr:helix-turn-helix domain-containing protein [Eubacterium sp.]
MEFNEKLKELRKSRSLTQEELAEALYVSRTAVSKWESGRGYPNLESLKEISRYFSISVDELICSEEIISAAEDEKKACMDRFRSLICSILDILTVLLLFLPVFGNGADSSESVFLYDITGLSLWIKTVFAAVIGITALNGICGVIISRYDRPVWRRHRLVTGMVLSITGTAVFIMARQPYAGIVCLAILVVKGLLICRQDFFHASLF